MKGKVSSTNCCSRVILTLIVPCDLLCAVITLFISALARDLSSIRQSLSHDTMPEVGRYAVWRVIQNNVVTTTVFRPS